MGHNMMTTQKWYEHITNVIMGNTANFNSGCPEAIDYVDERKGVPLAAMRHILMYTEAAASHAYLFEHDLNKFKQYAYVAGKLGILRSVNSTDPEPFFFPCDMLNIQDPMFLMLMSDSPQLREFLVRNIDNIANDTEAFVNRYDLNRHMIYNTLLMVEGKQLDRLKQRSEKVLAHPTPSKWLQKRLYDYRFFLAFAEQDAEAMKAALEPLFDKKTARMAAKETLSYFDFYLQPQIVTYAKIASMHGFDLGIDQEIAPRDLIVYDPLPADEYQDIFDFMKQYDLSYPYEYLQDWIDYYTFKTDKLVFGNAKRE
ncbi:immunity 49 family protein [Neisseria meningitidis]|uniref:immunity 49 family protein n=1 Tax=Neisseria meningitidis TaxID=487 RepID=UPI00027C8186|nr:immunity 49 family protein [Neisseria meningitidis]EJU80791.1 RNA polymerase sigma E factor [Neisseria meningitidis NM3081]ELL30497.1 putative rNA polymerase sigma E factor [Neisseria meningitidis 77221]